MVLLALMIVVYGVFNLKYLSLVYWLGSLFLCFSLFPFFVCLFTGSLLSFADVFFGIFFSSISFLFFFSICFIAFCVFLWSNFYMVGVSSIFYFYFFLLVFVCSMLVLVLSDSFFLLFLGWEGLGVSSFVLVVFYQNWMSYGGGLLTLLTNRLGDGLLLVSFSYWLLSDFFFCGFQVGSFLLFLIFVVLSFTKSAQVPFTSWLPAAMAAPTPVSALVHSSTLVTAGVWLMIRFSQGFFFGTFFWLFFGLCTLLVASFAAMKETDGKKVVALSTLSQLGLMFLSLSLGGKYVCFFHLLAHAFSKANLFLGVGSILHFRFSQQDSRFISSGSEGLFLFVSLGVSVLSLSGLAFFSGFFSKEGILVSGVGFVTSLGIVLLFWGVVSLTFSYCFLLSFFLSFQGLSAFFSSNIKSKLQVSSLFLMSSLAVLFGFFFSNNVAYVLIFLGGTSGFYWSLVFSGLFFLSFSGFSFWLNFFFLQKKVVQLFSKGSLFMSKYFQGLLTSVLESFYLVFGLLSGSLLFSQFFRVVILVVFLSSFFIFFCIKGELFY